MKSAIPGTARPQSLSNHKRTRVLERTNLFYGILDSRQCALKAEINITPMIDVLWVLIIGFMVVVAMGQQKGIKAQIPQPARSSHESDPARTIVIQVGWAGENQPPALKISEEDVPWAQLHDRLWEIFKQRAERVA